MTRRGRQPGPDARISTLPPRVYKKNKGINDLLPMAFPEGCPMHPLYNLQDRIPVDTEDATFNVARFDGTPVQITEDNFQTF